MKLDDLKQEWQQQHTGKSELHIQQMIKGRSLSVYARTRTKTIIESVAFLLVFFVFMTGLDAYRNAFWVNLFFAAVVVLGIANNVILYRSLTVNAKGDDLRTSLQKAVARLWWQIQFSVVFSVLFFSGILAFLLVRVSMTDQKILIAFLLLASGISIRTFFEVRKWRRGITELNRCLSELAGIGVQ